MRNVGRAAAGTSEVTGNIAGVAGAASELSRQSEHLTHEVHRFLGTARAA
ncbi:methyl-accepting chemotaxis protein [Methylobacterium gregans]|nr:methyl-accepting chemotaxis protein [Methylobacterium gregans]